MENCGGPRGSAIKTLVSDDEDPEFESHSERDFFSESFKGSQGPKACPIADGRLNGRCRPLYEAQLNSTQLGN